MRAALYARISTNDGRQFAENQIEEIRQYASRQNWPIVKEYVDRQSGAKGTRLRDQLAQLMEDAHRRRFDIVLVWALDRFTREGVLHAFQYIERLNNSGVQFRSVTEEQFQTSGPAGELFMAVAAWMAKQERSLLQSRIKAGLARARASGVLLGRRPVIVDQVRVLDLRAQGKSIRSIAKEFGCSRSTVHRIIQRSKKTAVIEMPKAG